MARQVLSNLDFNSQARILNLLDGASAQEPATVAQLNAAIEGLAWKDDVVCATSGNINLAAPGATVDGQTLVSGSRALGAFLARGQTTASENGIYIYNGAATPATRALDMNSSAEFNQAIVPVQAGTDAGTQWRCTTVNPTVGSTSIAFAAFGTSAPSASTSTAGIVQLATNAEVNAGAVTNKAVVPSALAQYTGFTRKFATTVGDGSATQYTITHNLNTVDVEVCVFRNNSTGDEVGCDVEHPSGAPNTVILRFASAPTTNQFRVVVVG